MNGESDMDKPDRPADPAQLDRPHPKPTAGLVAVWPIPAAADRQEDSVQDVIRTPVGLLRIVDLGFAAGGGAEVIRGIILEVGQHVPNSVEEEFGPRCTAYYYENKAVKIGGYHYLGVGQVVAWDPPPGEEVS